MKLDDLLKTSLDELRMQMLGIQVLFGFQFQGLFQDSFHDLSFSARRLDAVGFGMMILALALIVAVPSQHRIVEEGEASLRIYRVSKRFAELALLPFALAIGCDVYVTTARSFGETLGFKSALAAMLIALSAWYGVGWALRIRRSVSNGDFMENSHTPLHEKIQQMLTEARVVLPGVQALLGFQLVVMMTHAFDELPASLRLIHLFALGCLTFAMILLISPASIHRISFNGGDDPRLHSLGSLLITLALVPVAIGISCDLYIALSRLFPEGVLARAGGVGSFLLLIGLWYVLPFAVRASVLNSGVTKRKRAPSR
jgi:hypothetical protein